MSKMCSYVSPSVDTVEVDSDINVCAMSGTGGSRPGGGGSEPGWDDDEDFDDENII